MLECSILRINQRTEYVVLFCFSFFYVVFGLPLENIALVTKMFSNIKKRTFQSLSNSTTQFTCRGINRSLKFYVTMCILCKTTESLKDTVRSILVCFKLIWNEKKHNCHVFICLLFCCKAFLHSVDINTRTSRIMYNLLRFKNNYSGNRFRLTITMGYSDFWLESIRLFLSCFETAHFFLSWSLLKAWKLCTLGLE